MAQWIKELIGNCDALRSISGIYLVRRKNWQHQGVFRLPRVFLYSYEWLSHTSILKKLPKNIYFITLKHSYKEIYKASFWSHELPNKNSRSRCELPLLKLLVRNVQHWKQFRLFPLLFVTHHNLMWSAYCWKLHTQLLQDMKKSSYCWPRSFLTADYLL